MPTVKRRTDLCDCNLIASYCRSTSGGFLPSKCDVAHQNQHKSSQKFYMNAQIHLCLPNLCFQRNAVSPTGSRILPSLCSFPLYTEFQYRMRFIFSRLSGALSLYISQELFLFMSIGKTSLCPHLLLLSSPYELRSRKLFPPNSPVGEPFLHKTIRQRT